MPAPLSDEERKAWLAQQVDEHLRYGWEITSRTENLATLRRGRPVNHILHLLISLVTCGVWVLVWAYLAIFQGEKHKTISTRDADRRPQAAQNNQKTLLIVIGAVFAFLVVMAIIGSLLPD
jgi:ABC-type Fe3+ transport system permease subunit